MDMQTAKQATQAVVKDTSLKDNACLMGLPEISCPTGKKTVKKKEVVLLDDSTVSSDKISGGQLEWYPQDKLTDFHTLRKQAYSLFDELAVQVDKMYVLSLENIDKVLEKLDNIREKWDEKVQQRKASFDADLLAYKNANPAIASLVDDYAIPVDEFFSVFSFRYNPPLAFQPVFPEHEDELKDLARTSLLQEIVKEAGSQYKTSFTKGENVSQKAVTALKRIRSKLVDMSFLEPGIAYVVDVFDNVFTQLPKTGKIEGAMYHKLGHFVLQLSHPDTMKTAVENGSGINIDAFYDVPDDDVLELDPEPTATAPAVFDAPLDDAFSFSDDSVLVGNDVLNSTPPSAAPVQSQLDWMDF